MKRASPMAPILPVVLAGGEGARLAPISTPEQPKPFVPLPDGKSLLTHTLERVAGLGRLPPLLIGQAAQRFALLNHARAAGVPPAAILLEPLVRNTAMAVAVAAHWAMRHAPGAVLALLPADQAIAPTEAWVDAVRQATEASETHGKLCLLGVVPMRADPHFGYLQPGLPLPGSDAFAVARFIEKPEHPEALVPHCLWNAGQFFAPAAVLEALFAAHAPDLWDAAGAAIASAHTDWEFTVLGSAAYISTAPRSFDRSIVEKAEVLAVALPAHWHDLGTVEAWEAYTCETASSYHDRPSRTDRPWGFYETLVAAEGRLEKRLTLFPGCRLSLQRHAARAEEWRVLSGRAEVELEGEAHTLHPGDTIAIPAEAWHRLANRTEELLIIHEIQTGRPDESDIERRADDYGRYSSAQ